jgi:hypothetical protein
MSSGGSAVGDRDSWSAPGTGDGWSASAERVLPDGSCRSSQPGHLDWDRIGNARSPHPQKPIIARRVSMVMMYGANLRPETPAD